MTSIFTSGVVVLSAQDEAFITTWKTNNPGDSDSTSITIPIHDFYTYNYEVDWNNDGDYDTTGITGNITHSFDSAGTYTIRVRGEFPSIYFNNSGDKEKILSVDQWGGIEWKSFSSSFYGASNMNIYATDAPDLNSVGSFYQAFRDATNFNGDIGHWDVSNLKYMNYTFLDAKSFNQELGEWDVSNVTDMSFMFAGAESFNQDIGEWDVSNVSLMNSLFYKAVSFNQEIGKWNVGNVTNMHRMFEGAESFNQDVGEWDVSKVMNMQSLFYGAKSFNKAIGDWNVGSVTDMSWMFYKAETFNQDIGEWDVSMVEDMNSMFRYGISFDQDLSKWDVSKVADMSWMFEGAESFNQDIGEWDVSSVTDMRGMFKDAESFNQDIGEWDVASVVNMTVMFQGAQSFNQDIEEWDVFHVENMNGMFSGAGSFNQEIDGWDVSHVLNMRSMFSGAESFDQEIGKWDVSQVQDMAFMFFNAKSFNQDISEWDVSEVMDMSSMFYKAESFNQDIGLWVVTKVKDMKFMLLFAKLFDQNLGNWDISSVGNMTNMLNYSGLSTENYDETLIGWSKVGTMDVKLGASGLTYCMGETARSELIDKGWVIEGDELMCVDPCQIVAYAGNDTSYCYDSERVEVCAMEQGSVNYSWSNGSTVLEGQCVNLMAGQWILSVTDSAGCSDMDTMNIFRYDPIDVELSEDSVVNISGGTVPYDTVFTQDNGSLKVVVTDVNGCTGQDSLITTPTDDALSTSVNIFPNPVRDVLTIETKGYDSFEVILFNQYGRKLIHHKNAEKIDVSSFDPGIYYLQIYSKQFESQSRHFPVVIVR